MPALFSRFSLAPWQLLVISIILLVYAVSYSVFRPDIIPPALGEFALIGVILCSASFANPNIPYMAVVILTALNISGVFYRYGQDVSGTMLLTNLLGTVPMWAAAYLAQQYRRLQTDARSSSSRLQAVWDTVVDGMILIDNRGIINAANPASEELFGYQSSEMIGQNVKMLMPAPYKKEHDGYIQSYVETSKAKIIGIGREVQGQRKDGSIFPLYLAVSETKLGGELYFTGIVRDLTEQTEAQNNLLEAKEDAERANKAKTEFLSSMSHELRTPLNAVLGFAQLLQMDNNNPLNKQQRESLRLILRSGDHLLALINDVLDLSKIENGAIDIVLGDTNSSEVIASCKELIAPLAEKYEIDVKLDFTAHEDYIITADKMRLRQVLLNLVSNAVKYNKPKGSVRIKCEKVEKNLRILIEDTGIGIPADQADTIFTPFTRLGHENTIVEGTGIGLSISQTLMHMMNGSIDFKSSPTGTSFWIEIPFSETQSNYQYTHEEKQQYSAVSRNTRAKLLYIEDNPSNILLLEHLLLNVDSVEMESCPTAELGIELAKRKGYDLILMDLNLPGMSGLEAFSILQKDPRTINVPIVAITADVTTATQDKVKELGFRDYLSKPLDVLAALDTIQSHLISSIEERSQPPH
ncbi:hybrid sensor histidine kinase/response regulator [Kordiimonas laminariae]|uniref:hybrid sensor histidine kinase/response regulator n=1 Tax=Kordiimonas laminariae TaxID=2917717 RepID=UPI001FF1297B|nr:PAS domain-containing hybrid sensor histidine kinase/response regulator [Kordiimonas laminariae]MCK0069033.1 PAS domain S-box protein [Kordiimonas laminariae]